MIGETSTVPVRQQLQIVQHRVGVCSEGGVFPLQIVNWILSKWAEWYERHSEKKAELYVYKSRSKAGDAGDDPSAVDEDELEVVSPPVTSTVEHFNIHPTRS